MKKIMTIILSILFMYAYLFASSESDMFDISPTANITGISLPLDEIWDILGTFNTSASAMPGIETDGTNIYSTTWNGDLFSRYDMTGTHLGDFTISGVEQIRDMAYNGSYFYGSDVTMTIYVMDLANETLIGTIDATCEGITGIRHIAYDPQLDNGNGGFWIGNWDELGAVAMDGTEIYSLIEDIADSCYGTAYDEWSEGGPYLWMFFQDGSGAVIHQFDIAAQSLTNVTHDASDLPGFVAGNTAGGLASYMTDSGVFALIVNIQQNPNLIGIYEIIEIGDPLRPNIPTSVVVTPGDEGALNATIEWICPELNIIGDPLTELLEMRVYRDDVLVYADNNPTIGGSGSYDDTQFTDPGLYEYSIIGYNQYGEGIAVTELMWIGEDVPAAVTDLELQDISGCGYLSWTNPSSGMNNGYYTNQISGYHITRLPDNIVYEIAERESIFIDYNIPGVNDYSYKVVVYNAIGDGDSLISNSAIIGEGSRIFLDNFENGLNNWTVINNGGLGEWELYEEPYLNNYSLPSSSSGNVCAADADASGYGTSTLTTLELANSLDLTDYSAVNIQFDLDWHALDEDDFCYVDVSNDGGNTWNNVLTYTGTDVRNTHEMIDISLYAANQSDVLFRFESVQPGWDYWWVIDNVSVYATDVTNNQWYPPENLNVESHPDNDYATFTWDAPSGNIELSQHDGNTINAYVQSFDNGYGVVFDVSAYSDVTVETIDFHHSSWGLMGNWDYSIHIIDWDTYTEITEVTDLQTIENDDWEEDIYLGSVPVSGLIGIFIEPMGNIADDAYPCVDTDGIGPDGMSYFGSLSDYSSMDLSGIGDFLIDLWIRGEETDVVVQAPQINAEIGIAPTRIPVITELYKSFIPVQLSRALQDYNVFLDDIPQGNTDDLEWEFTGLDSSVVYTAGVEAVYDEGISNRETFVFTYYGRTDANSILPLRTELCNNYPNPFNPSTTIKFTLNEVGRVQLLVYNIKGQLVRTLVNENKTPNMYEVTWNGRNDLGKSVSSGIYFYRLKTRNFDSTEKMIMLK
jgi:hypothetical protein